MTDEKLNKMADEYAHNHIHYEVAKREDGTDYAKEVSSVTIKQAFLAGLKSGRPKWHKVADGDLPNTEREVLVFMWGSYYLGYYEQYDGEDSSWHFNDFDEKSEQVIAWCEIPQYKEKYKRINEV